jgi:hypothetical protein
MTVTNRNYTDEQVEPNTSGNANTTLAAIVSHDKLANKACLAAVG